jgi:DNA-binding IscR family transcriptional regulator
MGEEICVAPCVASRDECDNGFYERCVTREVWQRITGAVTERLEGITIGDLAADYAATQGKP